MAEFEFLRPTDKPAIIGVSTPEYLAACRSTLQELEYKVHVSPDHEDFVIRFGQIQYQIATNLYQKAVNMFRTALGGRSN